MGMSEDIKTHTPIWKRTFRYLLLDRTMIPRLVLMYVFIYANSQVTIYVKKYVDQMFGRINTLGNPAEYARSSMGMLAMLVVLHYGLDDLIAYLGDTILWFMFRKSLVDAVNDIVHSSNPEFHSRGTGRVQNAVTSSSDAICSSIHIMLVEIPKQLIFYCSFTYEIYKYFYPIVSIFYVFLILLSFLVCIYFASRADYLERKICNEYQKTMRYMTDILLNFDIVQSYNREKQEVEKYNQSFEEYDRISQYKNRIKMAFSFCEQVIIMIPHFIIIYVSLLGYDTGIEFGKFMLYNAIFLAYKKNLLNLRDSLFELARRSAKASMRIEWKRRNEGKGVDIQQFRGSITLKNADLKIGHSIINRNITLNIKKYAKVAITGYNGAGKSTFIKTLCGFCGDGHGIVIDGYCFNKLTYTSLRKLIAYVPQENQIFNDTVMYNLSYGQDRYDEAEVYAKCKRCGLHEFFQNLPNGYFTQCGESGKYLSGGQRQRVNFMRAIIKDSPILILDEPSSSLDKAAEDDLIRNIMQYCEDRTVLIVIHNLAKLKEFSTVMHFGHGKVQVFDSYADFISANPEMSQ